MGDCTPGEPAPACLRVAEGPALSVSPPRCAGTRLVLHCQQRFPPLGSEGLHAHPSILPPTEHSWGWGEGGAAAPPADRATQVTKEPCITPPANHPASIAGARDAPGEGPESVLTGCTPQAPVPASPWCMPEGAPAGVRRPPCSAALAASVLEEAPGGVPTANTGGCAGEGGTHLRPARKRGPQKPALPSEPESSSHSPRGLPPWPGSSGASILNAMKT